MSSAWIGFAAAVILFLAGVTVAVNQQRVVRARQEVELALRIASQTLTHVQLKLEESSARKGMPDGR
jgi:hypothetical protein